MGTALKDLLTRAPDNLSGWLLRAEWARRGRDRAKALDSLERAVELDPRNQGSLLALAPSLEDADRQEEALGTYRQLLADDPDHDLGTNGYGVLLYRMSRVDRAVEVFQGLLRSQPFFPPAHLNLAIIRLDQNRYKEARSLVERALALRPSNGLAQELRALLLEKEGGSPATLEAWKAALRFATTREAYRRAEAAVQRLEKKGAQISGNSLILCAPARLLPSGREALGGPEYLAAVPLGAQLSPVNSNVFEEPVSDLFLFKAS